MGQRKIRGEPDSDASLMQRYCAGDQTAFHILYGRYRGPLRRFVTRSPGHSNEADEIVQEVWTAVIRGRRSYRPLAKFSTYLFSIAHRRLQDRQRRFGRTVGSSDESAPRPSPEDLIDDKATLPDTWIHNIQLRQALLAAIDALPPAQREVFILKAETDMSLEEIAAATGAKPETAKSRLRYAIAHLRVQLRDWT